ncbi:MAG TPA: hypothetical protein IAC64_06110 [Candidatus Caccomorpha excrementavium]|nr:hypothetical protein [Candidatus Caccomorpha excrementavium]
MRFFSRCRILYRIAAVICFFETMWVVVYAVSRALNILILLPYMLSLLYMITLRSIVKDGQEDMEALRKVMDHLKNEEEGEKEKAS